MDEQDPDDTLELGGITMSGDIDMGTSYKVTGLPTYNVAGNLLRYGQSNPSLAGLSCSYINMNTSNKVTGLADGVDSGDAITKSQMDDAAGGGTVWLKPALVRRFKGYSYSPPGDSGPTSWGHTYRCGAGWSGAGKSDGDIAAYSYSPWETLATNSGGNPPAGTVLICDASPIGAPATSHANEIVTYETGTTYSYITPTKGDACHTWDSFQVDGVYDRSFDRRMIWVYWGTSGDMWRRCSFNNTWTAGTGFTRSSTYGFTLNRDTASIHSGYGNSIYLKCRTNSTQYGGLKADVETGEFYVNLDTDSCLETDASNGLSVLFDPNGGLEKKDVSGTDYIGVKLNDSPDTLDIDGSGNLETTGVPSGFEINGTATDTSVTATALNAMTDGSSVCDDYHSHVETEGEYMYVTFTAGAAVNWGYPVYLDSDGEVQNARADDESKSYVIGIANSSVSGGSPVVVTCHGYVTLGSSTTDGATIYLGDSGGWSTSLPSSGNQIVALGKMYTVNQVFVNPQFLGEQP